MKFFFRLKYKLILMCFLSLGCSIITHANGNSRLKENLIVLDTIDLDKKLYLELYVLKSLTTQLKSSDAFTMNKECAEQSCQNLRAHYDKLYNLERDLSSYQNYLFYSLNASSEIFESYVKETHQNEEYKHDLQIRLIVKDGLAQLAALITEITSVYGAIRVSTGAIPDKTIDRLMFIFQEADNSLTMVNNTVKVARQDGNADLIADMTGWESWSQSYTLLKSPNAGLGIMEDLDKLRASNNASQLEINNAKLQVTAYLVQVLGVWSADERNRMRTVIQKLDDSLKENEALYSQHYQRKVLKRTIYDEINLIRTIIGAQMRQMECVPYTYEAKREQRTGFKLDKNNFRNGLIYYKSLIQKAVSDKGISFKQQPCKKDLYRFVVKDGMGKELSFPIQLENIGYYSKGAQKIKGKASSSDVFELIPGKYRFVIEEYTSTDQVPTSRIDDWSFEITGNEKIIKESDQGITRLISVSPFARVRLDVRDKQGDFLDYTYTIKNEKGLVCASSKRASKSILLDLPANENLQLNIETVDAEKVPIEEKNISLIAGKLNKLSYVFEDPSYDITILDGEGNPITPFIEIIQSSNGQVMYKMGSSKSLKVPLGTGKYNFTINSSRTLNNLEVSKATIQEFELKGYGSKKIVLKPYARVQLEVVNKKGEQIPFRYVFAYKNKPIASSISAKSGVVETDVQTGFDLSLELTHKFDTQKKYSLNLPAGKISKLKYVFDDGQFKEEHPKPVDKTVTNKFPGHLKEAPPGWVRGVLYNSNDGGCKNGVDRNIEFENRTKKFFNLETGEYSHFITVAPGEKVYVATLSDGWHMRAKLITKGNYKNMISFWYLDKAEDGWWYAAGCTNGSKPSATCFCSDGKKDIPIKGTSLQCSGLK